MDAMGQTLAATSMENQIREGDAKTFGNTSSKVLTGARSVPLKGLNTEHAGYSAQAMISWDSYSRWTSCRDTSFVTGALLFLTHFFPFTTSLGNIFNLSRHSPGVTKPYRHKCHSLTDSPLEWVGFEGTHRAPSLLPCMERAEMSFRALEHVWSAWQAWKEEGGGALWKPTFYCNDKCIKSNLSWRQKASRCVYDLNWCLR